MWLKAVPTRLWCSHVNRLVVCALTIALVLQCTSAPAAKPTTGNLKYDEAVQKAADWLRDNAFADGPGERWPGRQTLAAYALLKAGDAVDSRVIANAIRVVRGKVDENGEYHPLDDEKRIYEAGIDAMLLADTTPEAHQAEILAIVNFLVSHQRVDGSWDYPDGVEEVFTGDTSMNQYALLGLWAATRAGVPVSPSIWDRAAQWHFRNQDSSGGFAYHPGLAHGPGAGAPTSNMTAGASGSLAIVRLHLYPDWSENQAKPKAPTKHGVLEPIDVENANPLGGSGPNANPRGNFRPQSSISQINGSIDRALGWTTSRFRATSDQNFHRYYFYYALERTASLNRISESEFAWYKSCGDALLEVQRENGSWAGPTPHATIGTSFVILFYMRSTGNILGMSFAGGVQLADRGLPDDLLNFTPGAEEPKKKPGPLDELLVALENADFSELEEKASEVVTRIRFGDREELIGQVDRLLKLAKHGNAEIKRTALWALGRSGDLKVAPVLIAGLRSNNVDVMREARNALCYVSRRPNGFGLDPNPLGESGDTASDDERTAAANAWRDRALTAWGKWWYRIRPYPDRDDLEELQFRRSSGSNQ